MTSLIVMGSSIFTSTFYHCLLGKAHKHINLKSWNIEKYAPSLSSTSCVDWDQMGSKLKEKTPIALVNSDYMFPIPASIINKFKYGVLQVYPSLLKTNYHYAPIPHMLSHHSKGNDIMAAATIVKFWNESVHSAEILDSIVGKKICAQEYVNYKILADIIAEPAVDSFIKVMEGLPRTIKSSKQASLVADMELIPLVFYDVYTVKHLVELDRIYKYSSVQIYSYLMDGAIIYLSNISVLSRITFQKFKRANNIDMECPGKVIYESQNSCFIRLIDGWVKCNYRLADSAKNSCDTLMQKKDY